MLDIRLLALRCLQLLQVAEFLLRFQRRENCLSLKDTKNFEVFASRNEVLRVKCVDCELQATLAHIIIVGNIEHVRSTSTKILLGHHAVCFIVIVCVGLARFGYFTASIVGRAQSVDCQ